MAKKALSAILLIAVCLACFTFTIGSVSTANAASEAEKLVIYNWADYIDEGDPDADREGLIALFEDYYYEVTGNRIEVEYNTFETNEEVVTKALLSDADMDLICPSEYTIEKLLRNDALLKINLDNITNYANIDTEVIESIQEVFSDLTIDGTTYDMTEYMVPYMWGTLGILYNTEYVTEEDIASGWGILWNKANNPDLNGKILIKDSVRDTYVAAVLYLKEEGRLPEEYDAMPIQQLINTIDETLLSLVEEALVEQRDILCGYEVDFGKDDMVQGNAYIDLAWSGDAMYAIEEGEVEGVALDYFVPEIGGNIWFDGWVVPKCCKNVTAAEMFIDFMCDPVNAIYNMMYIGYTSAVDADVLMENEEVCAVLEDNEYDVEEFFADPTRYPEVTEKLGVMKDFGDMADDAIMMWENIKPSNTIELIIILACLVGAVALFAVGYTIYSNWHGKYKRIK